MASPYYVVPDYWLSGYAVGDAVAVSAQIAGSATISVDALRARNAASAVAADLVAAASAVTVVDVSGSGAAALTATVQAGAIRPAASLITASAAGSAHAVTLYVGAASLTASTAVSAQVGAVRSVYGSTAIVSSFTASAIEKWEPLPDTPEIWTDATASGGIWTPVASGSKTWQDAA